MACVGVAGTTYVVLNPSLGALEKARETVFEVIGDERIPQLKINCENREFQAPVLKLSQQEEYFKFSCDYKSAEEKKSYDSHILQVNGAVDSGAKRDQLVCAPQGNQRYKCEYIDIQGKKDQKLQEKHPARAAGETKENTKFIRA
ncbi:hypothetical protein MHLP_02650 [Candidatus Mycoplasma haematolamae str. Purdue]|uniref:Uncharacterized protein n=1 Tax=Mycoplasma haematolamae (strain Purdue) TaxID=1212765 RepID=I7BA00_MYCHA|nr:hypothetical protein [Candidatus Mycoplasma haematolamae]AFO52110.1 hypothetical protein MHLP_02650 [Candidatus Mycoplasma haematolamae str. Purdue]